MLGLPLLDRAVVTTLGLNTLFGMRVDVYLDQIYESEVTYGPSPLIAGLRCIVKAELGCKVLVPAELLAEKR